MDGPERVAGQDSDAGMREVTQIGAGLCTTGSVRYQHELWLLPSSYAA